MTNLDPEYIKYLQDEIKHFDKELISILELPNVKSLRDRIKKDKRDTNEMLHLYAKIDWVNETIRDVKGNIRSCHEDAKRLTGFGLQRVKRKYKDYHRDTSYDL